MKTNAFSIESKMLRIVSNNLWRRVIGSPQQSCRFKASSAESGKGNVKVETVDNLGIVFDEEYHKQQEFADKVFRGGIQITSFTNSGFRLNQNVTLLGPVIVFPHHVFSWHIKSIHDISVDSLSIFNLMDPKPHLLLLGIGGMTPTPQIEAVLTHIRREYNINCEIKNTETACSTFNHYVDQGYYVAAAMVPHAKPLEIPLSAIGSQLNAELPRD